MGEQADRSTRSATGRRKPFREAAMHEHPYRRLLSMTLLSFGAMYVLMYAMVDRVDNVYSNLNQAYMAGLMAASMVIIEILLMGAMYPRPGRNAGILVTSLLAGVACFMLIREQAGIDDRQFLRSMISHHASAVLMCEEAPIVDPDVRLLCGGIVTSQQGEIAQMKALLAR
jgi:uncharacterized protein (DUF305 family)